MPPQQGAASAVVKGQVNLVNSQTRPKTQSLRTRSPGQGCYQTERNQGNKPASVCASFPSFPVLGLCKPLHGYRLFWATTKKKTMFYSDNARCTLGLGSSSVSPETHLQNPELRSATEKWTLLKKGPVFKERASTRNPTAKTCQGLKWPSQVELLKRIP
eukprot:6492118-Amphidinium_carterae.2